jgi:hypothetical protein
MSSESFTSGSSGRSIVIVHGGDFKPSGRDLLELIDSALGAGVERDFPDVLPAYRALTKELAYYGDLTNALLMEKGKTYDEQLDIGDRRNALHLLRQIDRRKKFSVQRYDNLPGKSAIAEFTAGIVGPVSGAVGLGAALITRVSRELGAYWNARSDFALQVRRRVRETLCPALDRGEKVMLISHGVGCVFAYDVLWQLSHDPEFLERYAKKKIDFWMTLGAPLGDNTVRRKLLGAMDKAGNRYPGNILSWHNVSAEDDYCCHDNTLANDFKAMLSNRLVSCIRDYQIYNLAVRYGKSNPHSSVGYYIHPRVTQLIVDWLKQDAEILAG